MLFSANFRSEHVAAGDYFSNNDNIGTLTFQVSVG